jgi:dTDP-4-dehydrorhamnose 3,5-epimerase
MLFSEYPFLPISPVLAQIDRNLVLTELTEWNNKMEVQDFHVPGPLLLTPKRFQDERGFFSETYSLRTMDSILGKVAFVQDNHSLSRHIGTIRGLHFQTPPSAQGKLVRVVRGSVFDVAVDIRRSSSTFGKFVTTVLSAENWAALWVPAGFAHGFCTLEADSEVIYKVTDFYNSTDDRGLAWDDPELDIPWPIKPQEAILSEKDKDHPRLKDLPIYFD